jgi:integrase
MVPPATPMRRGSTAARLGSPDKSGLLAPTAKELRAPASGRCHLIRHTCATHMLEGGADIRFIQQLLGRETLETTAMHTQVSIEQLKAVHSQTHPAEQLRDNAGNRTVIRWLP